MPPRMRTRVGQGSVMGSGRSRRGASSRCPVLDDVADATERAAGALRHEVKRSEDSGPSANTDRMMGYGFPRSLRGTGAGSEPAPSRSSRPSSRHRASIGRRHFGHRILRLLPPGTDPGSTCRPVSSGVVLCQPASFRREQGVSREAGRFGRSPSTPCRSSVATSRYEAHFS